MNDIELHGERLQVAVTMTQLREIWDLWHVCYQFDGTSHGAFDVKKWEQHLFHILGLNLAENILAHQQAMLKKYGPPFPMVDLIIKKDLFRRHPHAAPPLNVERELDIAGRGHVLVVRGAMKDFKVGDTVFHRGHAWLIRGVEGTTYGKNVGLIVRQKEIGGAKADYIIVDEMKEFPPEFKQEIMGEFIPPPKGTKICADCAGFGLDPRGPAKEVNTCQRCNGTGRVPDVDR
jgi:hypothetical protein